MTRVMVTGAAGFIGFALAESLSNEPDTHVYAVDSFIRGEPDHLFNELIKKESVSLYELDLSDPKAVSQLPVDAELIFHMAALNGTQNFYERPYDVMRCSTLPTFNLLEHYKNSAALERFVYAGSSEAYAGTVSRFGWNVPTAEDVPLCISDPTNPRWSYAGSKLHGELLAVAAGSQLGTPYTVIRYHNVYGPRMGDKHVIPDFLLRMKKDVFSLYGYKDTRSFIYIDDAVRATVSLARAEAAANEIINVGSAQETKIADLGYLMLEIAGIKAEIDLYPSPAGSVARRAPDTEKLKQLIDFREEWTLKEGLTETMEYYLR